MSKYALTYSYNIIFQELEGRSLRLYDGLRRERATNRVDTTPREIAQVQLISLIDTTPREIAQVELISSIDDTHLEKQHRFS